MKRYFLGFFLLLVLSFFILNNTSKAEVITINQDIESDFTIADEELLTSKISEETESKSASNVVVINFHSFFHKGEYPRLNHINVTPDSFKAILLALQDNGYNTVAEQDFYDFLNGNKNLPEKSIIITIDDGKIVSDELNTEGN